jgi:hypothetical protein
MHSGHARQRRFAVLFQDLCGGWLSDWLPKGVAALTTTNMSLAIIVKTYFATASHRKVGVQSRQHLDFTSFIEGLKAHRPRPVWYDGRLVGGV